MIEPEHLPPEFQNETNHAELPDFVLPSTGIKLDTLEANLIHQALDRTQGNRSKSAKLLGITRDTLLYRMQKHGFLSHFNARAFCITVFNSATVCANPEKIACAIIA